MSPWHIGASESCPSSKPFAVIKNADDSVAGCHPTKVAAKKQLAALYANESNALEGELVMAETTVSATERRFTAVPVELRTKNDRKKIGGYAAVFNRFSQNLGGFVEQVNPSFFNKSRGDGWPDVLARYNHDDNMLLGTSGGGTLRLTIDETGLDYEVDLPESRADIGELVGRGDVRKSSFAFRMFEDDWGVSEQGFPMRTLLSGQLIDVAPVNIPAYIDSSAGLRSLADKVQVDIEEVRSAAAADDLRKYLVRTDNKGVQRPRKTTLAAQARMDILARKEDPWG